MMLLPAFFLTPALALALAFAASASASSPTPPPTSKPTRRQFANCTAKCQDDLKTAELDYQRDFQRTVRIAQRQAESKLFLEQYKIATCEINPSLVAWPFEPWHNQSIVDAALKPSSQPILVTFCQGETFCYYQLLQRFVGVGWKEVKPRGILETVSPTDYSRGRFDRSKSDGQSLGQLMWGDMRLFIDDRKQLRTIYYVVDVVKNRRNHVFSPWTENFQYNKTLDSLHAGHRAVRLDISNHTNGGHSEKNWSPFSHNGATYFIYSVVPHRIIATTSRHFDLDDKSGATGGQAVEFAFSSPTKFHWDWGEPRGGSPAELIDTPDGPKYLTFTHSQKRIHHKAIKTYFMGAYLFAPRPPFEITHVTREPLVPQGVFYNQTATGWAWSSLDYILFPMGFARINNNTLVLSLGVNDNRCYLLEISLSSLLSELKKLPV